MSAPTTFELQESLTVSNSRPFQNFLKEEGDIEVIAYEYRASVLQNKKCFLEKKIKEVSSL